MRYVICVNRPGYLPEMEPYVVEGLDEAREAAGKEIQGSVVAFADSEAIPERYFAPYRDEAKTLTVAGGTIGPLPDGYVVDVSPAECSCPTRPGGLRTGWSHPCPVHSDLEEINA